MRIFHRRTSAFGVGLLSGICLSLLGWWILTVIPPPVAGNSPTPSPSPGSSPGEIELYTAAIGVAQSLYNGDYADLSSWVSADEGLLFVPYSTVERDRNLLFTARQVKDFADDKTMYLWGVEPGSGKRMEKTAAQYINDLFHAVDYAAAPIVAFNRVIKHGNAVENVSTAFPKALFVDFYIPPAESGGIDWSSLKVVFAQENGRLRLIALVRSVYTAQ